MTFSETINKENGFREFNTHRIYWMSEGEKQRVTKEEGLVGLVIGQLLLRARKAVK